jgi:hypothetical protein
MKTSAKPAKISGLKAVVLLKVHKTGPMPVGQNPAGVRKGF